MPVHVIPDVPTPLVEVRVQARRDPEFPDVVLVGQPPSTTNGHLILGPGADELGVDEQWLARYRVTAGAGSTLPGQIVVSKGSVRSADGAFVF